MHNMLPKLQDIHFPALTRGELDTLQINLGYLCNQSCLHCHVNAGPTRKELLTQETLDDILQFLEATPVKTVDLTGGAPEMNPLFRDIVRALRARNIQVMDRCNLTILEQPGYADLAEFLADNQVEVVASLPCYLEENVDAQRGNGVFQSSIRGLQTLNALGYGQANSGLTLSLVYNPQGPSLPPAQAALEADYKTYLREHFNIEFNQLFTVANMPIARFGSTLVSRGEFTDYMNLLRASHSNANLPGVMCRNLLSIDWQGFVYDCDFNQMLNIDLGAHGQRTHIRDLIAQDLTNRPIGVAGHCYGCTAGQGSSCGGALAA